MSDPTKYDAYRETLVSSFTRSEVPERSVQDFVVFVLSRIKGEPALWEGLRELPLRDYGKLHKSLLSSLGTMDFAALGQRQVIASSLKVAAQAHPDQAKKLGDWVQELDNRIREKVTGHQTAEIEYFRVDPPKVPRGGAVTVSWRAKGGSGVVIEAAFASGRKEVDEASGSDTKVYVDVLEPITFTLRINGTALSQTLTVQLTAQDAHPDHQGTPAYIRSFSVLPSRVIQGHGVLVSWVVEHAQSSRLERLSPDGVVLDTWDVGSSGSQFCSSINESCQFRLFSVGSDQRTIQKVLSVLLVEPPPAPSPSIFRFTVSENSVFKGAPVTVAWEVFEAREVVLEVRSETDDIVETIPVASSGSRTLPELDNTVRLVLQVLGLDGSRINEALDVVVSEPLRAAEIELFDVTPSEIANGSGVSVIWRVGKAKRVELECRNRAGERISILEVEAEGEHRFENLRETGSVELIALGEDDKEVRRNMPFRVKLRKAPALVAVLVAALICALIWFGVRRTPAPVPTPAPNILALDASPTALRGGQSTVIHWATDNATKVTLNGEPVPSSGDKVVDHVTTDTDFTLIATNSVGATERRGIRVSLLNATPKISEHDAAIAAFDGPARLKYQETARVSWSAEGSSAFLNGQPVPLSGSKEFPSLTHSLSLSLRVLGPGNRYLERRLEIAVDPEPSHTALATPVPSPTPVMTVPPPPSTAAPVIRAALPQLMVEDLTGPIAPCGTARLHWTATDATTVTVLPRLGVQPLDGGASVQLGSTSEFQVTAANAAGQTKKSIKVEVVPLAQTTGTLQWKGDVPQNAEIRLSGALPGRPVTVTFDQTKWAASVLPNESNHYCTVYLRSLKPGTQHKAEATWQLNP